MGVPDDRRPSYAELAEKVRQLRVEVAELRAQNAELRRRLDQGSLNSSRPPSSDSLFVRPAPRSLRGRSGRKPGGQTGHEGRALRRVEAPDQVEWHEPVACGGCGAGLPASAGMASVVCRQLFDIPAIRVRVTEHRLVERRCHCGKLTRAAAPAGVRAPTPYGPHAAAIGVYLYTGQFLSRQRTAEALSELFATPVSAPDHTASPLKNLSESVETRPTSKVHCYWTKPIKDTASQLKA